MPLGVCFYAAKDNITYVSFGSLIIVMHIEHFGTKFVHIVPHKQKPHTYCKQNIFCIKFYYSSGTSETKSNICFSYCSTLGKICIINLGLGSSETMAHQLCPAPLHTHTSDPDTGMSDIMRQISPYGLLCMSRCGLLFTIITLSLVVWTTLSEAHPHLRLHNQVSVMDDIIVVFFLFNTVANLVLLKISSSKNMYCSTTQGDRRLSGLPDACWHQCIDCCRYVPPRAHHCVLCRGCVLKRDHHCFFTGCCVGFYNQRYFVVFCVMVWLGAMYCAYSMWCYLTQHFGLVSWDYIIPWTVIRYAGRVCKIYCMYNSTQQLTCHLRLISIFHFQVSLTHCFFPDGVFGGTSAWCVCGTYASSSSPALVLLVQVV